MACFFPRPVVKDRDDQGKISIDFNPRDWASRDSIFIPCGKCDGCMADRSMSWAIRCYHESLSHFENSFVTLTYDDDHCPDSLQPADLRNFIKRCRYYFPMRYFACGELGDLTKRPHYHALIFGKDFLEKSTPLGGSLYTSDFLSSIWKNGFVSVGSVEFSSILYVAGYAAKKIGCPDTFVRMSRAPPLGRLHFERHEESFRRLGHVVIEGKQYPLPKRYFDWSDMQSVLDARSERFRGAQVSNDVLDARRALYFSRKSMKEHKL